MPGKTWYKIASCKRDLFRNSDGKTEIIVDGKSICIFLIENTLYACAAKCPHAGGSLILGKIDEKAQVECPIHHYRFNLKNGYNSSGEGYYLTTWPVEERADGIFIWL